MVGFLLRQSVVLRWRGLKKKDSQSQSFGKERITAMALFLGTKVLIKLIPNCFWKDKDEESHDA